MAIRLRAAAQHSGQQVSKAVRTAINEFLFQQARYLTDRMKRWVKAEVDPQIKLNFGESTGGDP